MATLRNLNINDLLGSILGKPVSGLSGAGVPTLGGHLPGSAGYPGAVFQAQQYANALSQQNVLTPGSYSTVNTTQFGYPLPPATTYGYIYNTDWKISRAEDNIVISNQELRITLRREDAHQLINGIMEQLAKMRDGAPEDLSQE